MAYRRKATHRANALPVQCCWEFHIRDDIWHFWLRVREVPRRIEGRTPKQYERYYLGLYLLALADHQLLSYPFKVTEDESPDFMLTWKSGETTGLEVTSATDQELQRWLTHAEKERPDGSPMMASPFGYVSDQLEREWCGFVREAIEKKVAKLDEYKPAARHDLLVSDDTRAGAGDRRKVLELLAPWAHHLKREGARLGRISAAASLDILYDIGGESRIFPYVHWSAPGLEVADSDESFSQRAELAGQVTVERAIREPSQRHIPNDKTSAVPGYYVDIKGRIVKRTPEGRRFEIRIKEDGSQVVVRELPSA
jgi:hypothetical protein